MKSTYLTSHLKCESELKLTGVILDTDNTVTKKEYLTRALVRFLVLLLLFLKLSEKEYNVFSSYAILYTFGWFVEIL